MKKAGYVYITIYLLILIIPAVMMPFSKNSGDSEKRELAKAPSLVKEGRLNEDFREELDQYLSDHIGLRNAMVTLSNRVMGGIFSESAVDSVIKGKDGWLFFAEDKNDYLNVATISKRNAVNIARSYRMVQDNLKKQGSDFVFAVVPNKSSLYDKLPYYYVPLDEKGNIELVQEAFEKEGVKYADLYAGLKKADEVLYLKTDTHWDYKGALYGFNMIMDAAGFAHEDFSDTSFTEKKDHVGDLSLMLYSDKAEKDVQKYPNREFEFSFVSHEKKPDSMLLRTYNEKGQGNVLYFRDSYFDTCHVFAAESAENAVFSRSLPYDISMAEKYDADLTVVEIVERNLINLAGRAPKMEAPETDLDLKAKAADSSLLSLKTEEDGDYVHIFGEISESLLSDEYRVYILLTGEDGTKSYEAFPIYEKELMGSTDTKDNGFSAYIPSEKTAGKHISVVVESGNEAYLLKDKG
ncbi:MAG: hypothetical protein IKR27_09205 [Lachnospiraceae bacterium]|nr:hypothetical protein [Lachnospiraceae bacterium]